MNLLHRLVYVTVHLISKWGKCPHESSLLATVSNLPLCYNFHFNLRIKHYKINQFMRVQKTSQEAIGRKH